MNCQVNEMKCREKNKTNSGNIETGAVSSRGRVMDKDAQKPLEKKVVEETMEKTDVKDVREVLSAAKKAVLSELVENKNGLKKPTGETSKKENAQGRGEKRETLAQEMVSAVETTKKAVLNELIENKNGLKKSTGETIKKEIAETMEKADAKEGLEGRGEKGELLKETAKKNVLSESAQGKSGLKKPIGETFRKKLHKAEEKQRKKLLLRKMFWLE